MDEYQHLRESAERDWIADMNRVMGAPTYPAEPVGATALERRIGMPANFKADEALHSEARAGRHSAECPVRGCKHPTWVHEERNGLSWCMTCMGLVGPDEDPRSVGPCY